MGIRNDCMYISGLLVSTVSAPAMMECARSGSL
jgi:hypothetical protein